MTRFDNRSNKLEDAGQVSTWIKENLERTRKVMDGDNLVHLGKAVSVSMRRDGTVASIDINLDLTASEEAQIVSKFPELAGKKV